MPASIPNYLPKHETWHRFFGAIENIKKNRFPVCLHGEKGVGKNFCAHYLGHAMGIPSSSILELPAESLSPDVVRGSQSHKMLIISQRDLLTPSQQEAILRLIQNSGNNLQIVWTSQEKLLTQMQSGRFMEELYYALNIFEFGLPSLDEMPEDIPGFANFFLEILMPAKSGKNVLSSNQIKQLRSVHWSANLDSLQFVLKRSIAQSSKNTLELDLHSLPVAEDPFSTSSSAAVDSAAELLQGSLQDSVNELKRRLVLESLKRTGGNKSNAAKLLGVSKAYIFRLINMLDIHLD